MDTNQEIVVNFLAFFYLLARLRSAQSELSKMMAELKDKQEALAEVESKVYTNKFFP